MTAHVSRIPAIGLVLVVASLAATSARQPAAPAVQVDADDLGGVVSGAKGPEAGVWVIAETTDLPTKFTRIVVTDDRGRYLMPDLPKAGYTVWVRGYGLVDSPKVKATPGQSLNLKAVAAPSAHAAAEYYPAGYWFSLVKVPEKSEFPGTGPSGNGISPSMETQAHWLRSLKSGGCTACHQLGNKATREVPPSLGKFADMAHAWDRRCSPARRAGTWWAASPSSGASARCWCWVTGPIASHAANCRRRRRGRRASSGTS